MKRNYYFLCSILSCLFSTAIYCQANQDSVMLAHGDKWIVKQNKGLFGLSKPDFGPYTTLDVAKIDSPVLKKKTKDSSHAGAEISREGTDVDLSEFVTIQKNKIL